ncbi:MAG TPA: hypothetical protein VIF62_27100 [Labilithrix sp.]
MRRFAFLFAVACALVAVPAHAAGGLAILESSAKPAVDYEAEVYSGVPLDGTYAKERGLTKGLVWMVFEKQRRPAFRVSREKIRKVVRLVADDVAPVMVVKTTTASTPRTKLDVLDTQDGIVVVETVTANAGIFTTSDVYVFPRGAAIDARLVSVGPAARDRVKRAIALAQGAKPSK